MNHTFGRILTVTLFGESHGPMIGAVLDGMPAGVSVDEKRIAAWMDLRRTKGPLSSARHEADHVQIVSGVKNGKSEGTPITLLIENHDMHSQDYKALSKVARPSHADYAASMKYDGFEDGRGGGNFSGRLTAPLVAAGAIVSGMLEEKGIVIGSHIYCIEDVWDESFSSQTSKKQLLALHKKSFAVCNTKQASLMQERILQAKQEEDSVGGMIQTMILGVQPGLGEPNFDSIESCLSHAIFSIPAIKGISFGAGFEFARMRGSKANDAFVMKGKQVLTKTNHNGGINGGISNGMPIVFQTIVKPTPSIAQKQATVDFKSKKNTTLEIHGRHDPCIVPRACIVVDAMSALTIADLCIQRYGTLWFQGEKK